MKWETATGANTRNGRELKNTEGGGRREKCVEECKTAAGANRRNGREQKSIGDRRRELVRCEMEEYEWNRQQHIGTEGNGRGEGEKLRFEKWRNRKEANIRNGDNRKSMH